MHRFLFRVRYADTDQMGFAYYANFLRWFEVGRAELIRGLCDSNSQIVFEPLRTPDDPNRRQPDIAKAKAVLGWEPGIALEDGLRRTIAWYRTAIAGQTAQPGVR